MARDTRHGIHNEGRSKLPPKPRFTLTHPSGAFSVHVTESRAQALLGRGYKAGPSGLQATAPKRPELNARAKELGIPAVGTNAELAEAIAKAEAAT